MSDKRWDCPKCGQPLAVAECCTKDDEWLFVCREEGTLYTIDELIDFVADKQDTLAALDERGFVFVGKDGNAYRCAMWGDSPWLFRWQDGVHTWVSIKLLNQTDVWMLPHNLTQEQKDLYHAQFAKTVASLQK